MGIEIFSLKGKVAMVSGASSGLGKRMALCMAEAGADVAVFARRQEMVEQTAKEIRSLGRKALAARVDHTNEGEVKALVERVVKEFGKIDILVNNAGMDIIKPAVEYELEEWEQVMKVNLTGYFNCALAAGKEMLKRKSGKIINISSIASIAAIPRLLPYSVSKAGVDTLTRILAIEWAPYNVRVNAIAPAYMDVIMAGAAHEHDVKKE
ncbi:MAG: SDR family NAD(P)-dependent oxidoreductase, partial [Chloroflexi bacterium]|nr:SDR family NAD(P)-dependent oxidoreductase [Chloroflexota bacterium]